MKPIRSMPHAGHAAAALVLLSAVAAPLVRAEPTITTDSTLPAATEAVAYSFAFSAQGGAEPYTWSVAPTVYSETSAPSTFSEKGDAQGWNGDDDYWTLALPFAFPFFGETYTEASVTSNGEIEFGDDPNSWYSSDVPSIAVLAADLRTDAAGADIFVAADSSSVTIRWKAVYYSDETPVNASATLFPDGRIVLSYGSGNASGGDIAISDGNAETVSALSDSGSMDHAADVVFVPTTLPDGLSLAENGTLSGTPAEPGEYLFDMIVEDGNGETDRKSFVLTVAENPALRPSFSALDPEPGFVNLGDGTAMAFAAAATHPSGGAVALEWFVDGGSAGTGGTFEYTKPDEDAHEVRCVASATDLPAIASRTWTVGFLRISDPESVTVALGQTARLSTEAVSPFGAAVTWFDASDDSKIGEGETLVLRRMTESTSCYVVAENAFGSVTSAVATVTVSLSPAVDRVHKLTGAPFLGNRLVLRAKTWGDPTGATFEWKRDGTTVSTDERLDIESLSAADFGTYTLTMSNAHGTGTSEPFVLAEAKSGVPVGWGANGNGRTEAPEGEGGFVQVASGMNFNLGLKTDGTLTAWGYNGHGGCDVPSGLSGVSFVAAGGYESQGAGFAVKTDGSVVAWGQPAEIDRFWGDYGHWEIDYDEWTGEWSGRHWVVDGTGWIEITNGWDIVSTMPADLSGVVKVDVAGEFAIALKADGSVVTWGREYGEWEWDDAWEKETWVVRMPWTVPDGLDDVVDIAAGGRFAFALKADGSVVAWGDQDPDAPVFGVREFPRGAIAVAANTYNWGDCTALALVPDGTIEAWGNPSGDGLDLPPDSENGFTAIDAGQRHAMALDADGNVSVWGSLSRNIDDIPATVSGAFAIAAGGYHCTALLPDADGDTISDAEEILLGRDPAVPEDWRRAPLAGTVTIDGGKRAAAGALVRVYDASGRLVARTRTDEDGRYETGGLVPANYFVSVEADGAADAWADDALPPVDGIGDNLAPGVAWATGADAPVAVGADAPDLDFDLVPGELAAWARVEADKWTMESEEDDWEEVVLPSGTKVYLDLWPVSADDSLAFDLGEVAASPSALDGLAVLPHAVTVKRPEAGAQIPSPDLWVRGSEGRVVSAVPSFSGTSGAVRIVTDPAGAEVWIDYADESLGTTPLTVGNLAAGASHAHVLLLRKDGFLRPRPVVFEVDPDGGNEIAVPLAADSEPGMGVVVSSGIPGMDVYVDYLPTGEVTPAEIGGLDPASHAGDLWHSTSHSILLRHEGLRPFAPRAVPEPDLDPDTLEPVPGDWAEITIVAPNSFDDSDGDGIRNDVEAASGTDPFDPTDGQYTTTTPVPVPYKWIDAHPTILAAHGGDYEAAALADDDGDGHENWREFVACTDPEDAGSVFRAIIAIVDGAPEVWCEPYLPAIREYILLAAPSLDGDFDPADDPDDGSAVRFFRFKVRLK